MEPAGPAVGGAPTDASSVEFTYKSVTYTGVTTEDLKTAKALLFADQHNRFKKFIKVKSYDAYATRRRESFSKSGASVTKDGRLSFSRTEAGATGGVLIRTRYDQIKNNEGRGWRKLSETEVITNIMVPASLLEYCRKGANGKDEWLPMNSYK